MGKHSCGIFSGQTAGMNFNKVVVFFEFVPGLGGDGSTYYYDDIEVVVPFQHLLCQ